MSKVNRVACLIAGSLCAFGAVLILRNQNGSLPSRSSSRTGKHPPVEELAEDLKQAWAGRHIP
jgi:hypothetical protein